jgi:hypothetical protein
MSHFGSFLAFVLSETNCFWKSRIGQSDYVAVLDIQMRVSRYRMREDDTG